jgi:hypothetical protein
VAGYPPRHRSRGFGTGEILAVAVAQDLVFQVQVEMVMGHVFSSLGMVRHHSRNGTAG